MTRLGERASRERQLSVAEVPLFAVGKVRTRFAVMLRMATGQWRSELVLADRELEEAQRHLSAWAGYPYARR